MASHDLSIDTSGFSPADFQTQATNLAIEESRRARESIRGDLSPFQQQGAEIVPGLSSLVNDPNQQASILKQDPFFGKIADKATQQILASQAAKGKAGAGETANMVQNKLLQIGTGIVNRNIDNRFNLAAIGSNAAAGVGSSNTASASQISDLLTQGGNAQAAGIVANQNNQNQERQNRLGLIFAGLNLYNNFA